LKICHFDPLTGADLRRGPLAREDCEAACYDCLMNYSNQRDHALLDRGSIKDILLDFMSSTVRVSPTEKPRAVHLADLQELAGSELERQWLHFLEDNQLHLPSHAQLLIKDYNTRPDFYFDASQAAVYIDGPHHDYPERRERDRVQTECMEDLGYTVIRFREMEDWMDKINKYPNIFGRKA
jgi:very-short-patch-repair endonuclease